MKLFFIVFQFVVGLNLSAQTSMDYENELCDSSLNMPFSERVKVYPFNRAVSIQFVAYRGTSVNDGYNSDGMPIQDSVICFEDLLEVKTLTLKQVEYFSDLVVNQRASHMDSIVAIADCYDPRNGILFFDVNGKVFEYVDICFECSHVYGKNYRDPFGAFCSNKFSLIRDLFEEVGIEYGITTTEMLKK